MKNIVLLLAVFFALSQTCLFSEDQALSEKEWRNGVVKAYKSKKEEKIAEALGKLDSIGEKRSYTLLGKLMGSSSLKPEVKATIATLISKSFENDKNGLSVSILCKSLSNPAEKAAAREACAKALEQTIYKEKAILTLIKVISSISEEEKSLHKLGYICVESLFALTDQRFGAGPGTSDKWKNWWNQNKKEIQKEDKESAKNFPPK